MKIIARTIKIVDSAKMTLQPNRIVFWSIKFYIKQIISYLFTSKLKYDVHYTPSYN